MTDSYTYYPIFNQLTSHTDGLSHTTSYSDDSFGHLTQITDPLGNAVKFTSDGKGERQRRHHWGGCDELLHIRGGL